MNLPLPSSCMWALTRICQPNRTWGSLTLCLRMLSATARFTDKCSWYSNMSGDTRSLPVDIVKDGVRNEGESALCR